MKQNGHPVECVTCQTLISQPSQGFGFQEDLPRSICDGKTSWTPSMHQGHWQAMKPEVGKIVNCSYFYFYSCQGSLFHYSSFTVVDTVL